MRAVSRPLFGLAALLLTGAASQASAQSTVNATATVASALTVTTRDLQFFTVFPGVAKAVVFGDNTASSKIAGRFQIAAEAGSTVSLTWNTLPTNLISGSNQLPISITGCSTTSATAVGCTANYTFTNGNITMPAGVAGSTQNQYIFVAGTVTPGASQPAGSYSAAVTVTVAYTGS